MIMRHFNLENEIELKMNCNVYCSILELAETGVQHNIITVWEISDFSSCLLQLYDSLSKL